MNGWFVIPPVSDLLISSVGLLSGYTGPPPSRYSGNSYSLPFSTIHLSRPSSRLLIGLPLSHSAPAPPDPNIIITH